MWKAAAGKNVKSNEVNNGDADEWETDPDFVNDVSEKEQRWGAKTVEGSGHQASMKLDQLREQVCFTGFLWRERNGDGAEKKLGKNIFRAVIM